ncbi:hypothetical protein M9H77_21025 [Catharanthus roseus]|uniref:Uncharacterized protein n=1 Tax=Catharanthus roseus TaxID=4058 RepID=A0ACC0AMM4_CATRO|nr:hypothetical protein M9H77_21025 [Catharanthus roseus]
MSGKQPIRPRRSLALGLDDRTLSPLARTRYSSHSSTITATSSVTLLMEDIDEGIEESSDEEHNDEGRGSFEFDLEVVGMTPGTGLKEEVDFDDVTDALTGDAGLSGQK